MSISKLWNAAKQAAEDATNVIILESAVAKGALTADDRMMAACDLEIEKALAMPIYKMQYLKRTRDDYWCGDQDW